MTVSVVAPIALTIGTTIGMASSMILIAMMIAIRNGPTTAWSTLSGPTSALTEKYGTPPVEAPARGRGVTRGGHIGLLFGIETMRQVKMRSSLTRKSAVDVIGGTMLNVKHQFTKASNPARPRKPFLFASLATALAGFLDAVGFEQLNHLYVSFMSGNSTRLGMAFSAGDWTAAIHAAGVIAAFVMGAFAGTLLSDALAEPMLAQILSEIGLCALAASLAACDFGTCALLLVALIMGMQNVMHQSISDTDAGKGFITGALFGFGQAIAHAIKNRGALAHAHVHACSWLCFVVGVFCGTRCVTGLGIALSLGVACLALTSMLTLMLDWFPGARG